jgi:hypothetical protein
MTRLGKPPPKELRGLKDLGVLVLGKPRENQRRRSLRGAGGVFLLLH